MTMIDPGIADMLTNTLTKRSGITRVGVTPCGYLWCSHQELPPIPVLMLLVNHNSGIIFTECNDNSIGISN